MFRLRVQPFQRRITSSLTIKFFSGVASSDDAPIFKTLKDVFGFDTFRGGQLDVIRSIVNGKSALAVFPTGSGKSLCYQLPACMLSDVGMTVVVTPLLALMKDQMDTMRKKGIKADMLGSSLSFEERNASRERISKGETQVLLVAPEQLHNESSKALILSLNIALLVIDEVHCISEWGHSFRPDYLRLAHFAEQCGATRVLGLTATATPPVIKDICAAFDISPENCATTPFHRSNLHLNFHQVSDENRNNKLLALLKVKTASEGPTIVYVTKQETAMTVAAYLTSAGYEKAKPYHAGMKTEEREAVQNLFMTTNDAIIVATIAFGMGIDKSNVRKVIHYNLPKSLEGYAQEVGRAGRDGLPSYCDLLYCPSDVSVLEAFARCNTPSVESVEKVLREVFLNSGSPYPDGTVRELAFGQLSSEFDVTDSTLRMLLAFVDIYHQHLEETTSKYSAYQFKMVDPQKKVAEVPQVFLRRLPGHTGEVLARHCQLKKTLCHLQLDGVVNELQLKSKLNPVLLRNKLLIDLNSLKDELTMTASGVMSCYCIVSTPSDIRALAQTEYERFVKREKQDLARLQQVLDLISSQTCHGEFLINYFEGRERSTLSSGQHSITCQCQWCSTSTPKSLIAKQLINKTFQPITENKVQALRHSLSDKSLPCDDPLLLTRVLLGSTSPRITALKLRHHPVFNLMGESSYDEVLELCKRLCKENGSK